MARISMFKLHIWTFRKIASIAACNTACMAFALAGAQEPAQQISITGVVGHDVEKSYRKMIRGMDYFETARGSMAPKASLRFKLLPRKPGTAMDGVVLEVIGATFDDAVPIAADHTFILVPNPRAIAEDAVVVANRRQLSMTWRTEVRTPGLGSDARRLGDLRLECEVGVEADLVSNSSPIARFFDLFSNSKDYCDRKDARYLFFAERPIFTVTLVSGSRREILSIDKLYAMASDDNGLQADLPYCDCEMLLDRSYFLPLGDPSWPNDTRVEFEYMSDAP